MADVVDVVTKVDEEAEVSKAVKEEETSSQE